ncbi:MAG TPA: hypothetical protein VFK86_16485 [Bauldia sp.]|nr:hypothetical protein [Bauldia sp.]
MTADKPETGGTGAAKPPPGTAARPLARPRVIDEKLQAIDELCRLIKERLGLGLILSRDNPGKTPPTWSVTGRGNRKVLTFGLVDRTFFWTWDDGVSNHYSKDAETMARIITEEMRRFGYMV